MLELFAGQDIDYLLNKLSYKEALSLRDARIKRKTKELKEEEEARKQQERQMARDKILR